jgi:hypothetical protein
MWAVGFGVPRQSALLWYNLEWICLYKVRFGIFGIFGIFEFLNF